MISRIGIAPRLIIPRVTPRLIPKINPLTSYRFYTTNTTTTKPKSDKGQVILNKITRAFTFSLSSLLVVGASAVAILVVSLTLSELFLPSGDTRTFNKAVKLIEQNADAQKVLGFAPGHRLKAYGIVAADRWVRNRPVQSVKTKDHLYMKFQVESDSKYGIVTLEQIDNSLWSTEFEYIALDVPGHRRVYIIPPPKVAAKSTGFLGLNWGPKRD